MIETLHGLHETVDYRKNTQIRLYNNDETENYPPHWHIPFELIMPVDGLYRVRCGDNEYVLQEKDVLIICPGVVHELFASEAGTRIIFQVAAAGVRLKEVDLITSMISPAILITPSRFPGIHGDVCRMMSEISEEYNSPHPYAESAIYSRFLMILAYIGRYQAEVSWQNFEVKKSKQKEYMEKFLFVCNYINEHFSEDLTLEKAASVAGFSKYHFSRLFKQYVDTTFYKYLNQQRIAYAKNLLISNELSVIEVALQCGFTNLSSFLRMFKIMTGMTPSEFRRIHE